MKVIKFGGSSVANATQLQKVKNIVTSDEDRRIVVVSAPGKRFKEDIKVTDLLIDLGTKVIHGSGDVSHVFKKIIERYAEIAADLNIKEGVIEEITQNLNSLIEADTTEQNYFMDAIKASGEDNNARLIAAYFRSEGIPARYMNPAEAGLFVTDDPGNAHVLPESYFNLYKLRDYDEILIFPGFFGYTKDHKLVTFSRGGSDITGAIIANGVKATLYENFTDVDAIAVADPGKVDSPIPIDHLTYAEMRELSYAGFNVFHDEALQPAFFEGIPVNIKNTNNPDLPGTMITRTRPQSTLPISGIASNNGFASIYIKKYLMNREVGFVRKVLSVLEQYNVSFEHIVSGIDDIDVIFKEELLTNKGLEDMLQEIKAVTAADYVEKRDNLSLMMVVGEGMNEKIGLTALATKALSEANINLEIINQGSSEISIMFGIKEENEGPAVKAIYDAFFSEFQ